MLERTDPKTLETRKIPFNLGKLVLGGDRSQDALLEPGDIVTIFSKADFSIPQTQQVKEVRIEGEITMAGAYTLLPGETLRQVVERAGGLTPKAYLYGAQFTRESTRRVQQKRYKICSTNMSARQVKPPRISQAASLRRNKPQPLKLPSPASTN